MVYFDLVFSQLERAQRLEELGMISHRWREVGLPDTFRTEIGKRAVERSLPRTDLPPDMKSRWAKEAKKSSCTHALRHEITAFQGSDLASR